MTYNKYLILNFSKPNFIIIPELNTGVYFRDMKASLHICIFLILNQQPPSTVVMRANRRT